MLLSTPASLRLNQSSTIGSEAILDRFKALKLSKDWLIKVTSETVFFYPQMKHRYDNGKGWMISELIRRGVATRI
ncbi:hypothetical protein IAD21_00673 [Abditibacteriota bacterium]|nr:hypothetical protein IAD21_00673 [Abditibacteriota bacterium]